MQSISASPSGARATAPTGAQACRCASAEIGALEPYLSLSAGKGLLCKGRLCSSISTLKRRGVAVTIAVKGIFLICSMNLLVLSGN
ncbi:hypothetical protein KOW79_006178 [Hemibagrus wyckioides]|uniref:Uncharacterized protein n=1 Tax=Hemibagrus wyckioides TaxID=337641 RepID=A0A9D3NWQ7_9TELE|nr:hypothetical protein KOW79_006178 [Hemibagrus wyckioides]